ncbi:MAG TPA: hypothetical protein VK811_10660 [Candidatus Acidoferrum sp.]|jgi:hypothetical protein|nr:hypothetical protein [Candidatus Acidoferrum sp.]
MKTIYYFAGLVTVMLLCTGCWPARITSSPAAWGYVMDAKTHEPIVGAKAEMSYTWRAYWSDLNPPQLSDLLANPRPPFVTSDTNGQFFIPREREWVMMSLPVDFNAYGTLVILQNGYKPGMFPASTKGNQDKQPQRFFLTPVQE